MSKAEISVIDSGTFEVVNTAVYGVTIDGELYLQTTCKNQAAFVARFLNRARESGHRLAMQILVEQLGYCEGHAEDLYNILKGDTKQATHHEHRTIQ